MNVFIKKSYSRVAKWAQQLANLPLDVKIHRLKSSLPSEIIEKTSFSDLVEDYKAICQLAAQDNTVFAVFKRSSAYRRVLEHATEAQGQDCFDIIVKEQRDLLQYFPRFHANDLLGDPITFRYAIGRYSPTTLRYIKILGDLKTIFSDLNNLDIIEIGCGYGGQCKVISDVFAYRSYRIIDLSYVMPLIVKYLDRCDVPRVHYGRTNQMVEKDHFDLVISNYAFSECIKKVQDDYMQTILYKSRRGYITYNYDGISGVDTPYNRGEIVELLSKVHIVRILDERPKTGRNNFVIVWGERNES